MRCRLHGGLSSGARTEAGRERCRAARLKNGRYTREVAEAREEARAWLNTVRSAIALAQLELMSAPPPTDVQSALERLQIEDKISRALAEIRDEIYTVLREKLGKPLDLTSEVTLGTTAWRAAAACPLFTALREVALATVLGPPGAPFTLGYPR